jgi:hypothetical protein
VRRVFCGAALRGTTTQLTFTSKSPAGWYRLKFATPLKLATGTYRIGTISGASAYVAGERYDSVANAEDYNTNTYASGPSNPFGSFKTTNEQMSLYATERPMVLYDPPELSPLTGAPPSSD